MVLISYHWRMDICLNPILMMTSSNGNIYPVTGPLCGEFTGEFHLKRPETQSFDVFFYLRLIKRLSKQSRGWWSETPPRTLWRHCNVSKLCLSLLSILYTVGFFGWIIELNTYRNIQISQEARYVENVSCTTCTQICWAQFAVIAYFLLMN